MIPMKNQPIGYLIGEINFGTYNNTETWWYCGVMGIIHENLMVIFQCNAGFHGDLMGFNGGFMAVSDGLCSQCMMGISGYIIWGIYNLYNVMKKKLLGIHTQHCMGYNEPCMEIFDNKGYSFPGAKRRKFSGMIPAITSKNHPSNPQQPIHSLRLAPVSISTQKLWESKQRL